MAENITKTDLDHPVFVLETAAIHRWLDGDPDGFLEISADDVLYTDPFTVGWLVGKEALTRVYDSIRGQVHADRFAFVDPRVIEIGDAVVLDFDFVSWGGGEVRWHCTEVYRRAGETWQIVSTHWSFQPAPAA